LINLFSQFNPPSNLRLQSTEAKGSRKGLPVLDTSRSAG
jgi:hypothetical protein